MKTFRLYFSYWTHLHQGLAIFHPTSEEQGYSYLNEADCFEITRGTASVIEKLNLSTPIFVNYRHHVKMS